ncbi:MAG TPA: [LysW]-lysine hydrolase [Phycisphaerales bacterium]|nr:[LysW]-lysine hydrolase [Phycisphaerales bacterium]
MSMYVGETPDEHLLRELVEIPSLSGAERPAAEYLVARMRERGMRVSIDEAGNAVGEVGGPDASGRCTDIVLLGHMDTVPGDIPVRREGDVLHGRGSVDAKGPLAAFVCAATGLDLPAGVRVIVIGATEEETATSRGARHAAATYRPAACIIGEPSHWDGVTLGYKGRLLVEYRAEQPSGHTARPVASVADECCAWWENVRREAEAMRGGERVFDRVQATLRRIQTRSDGLTDVVEAQAGFRLPPGVLPEDVEAICRRYAPASAVLTCSGAEVAYVADRGNVVVRSLTGAIRGGGGSPTLRVKTGTADLNVVGPVWGPLGCQFAAYGPGDSHLDHTPEEWISLAEYARSITVLRRAIAVIAAELAAGRAGVTAAAGAAGQS